MAFQPINPLAGGAPMLPVGGPPVKAAPKKHVVKGKPVPHANKKGKAVRPSPIQIMAMPPQGM